MRFIIYYEHDLLLKYLFGQKTILTMLTTPFLDKYS